MKFAPMVLVWVLVLVFAGCGTKPPATTGFQPLNHFKVERVSVDSSLVVFSVPIKYKAFTQYQMYAAYYVYNAEKNDWVFSPQENYQVRGRNLLGEKITGYLYVPPNSATEWILVRAWATSALDGTTWSVPMRKDDDYYREDCTGKPGNEFLANIKTGEHYPVPKRE